MIMKERPQDSSAQPLISRTGCSFLEDPLYVSQTCEEGTLFHVVIWEHLGFQSILISSKKELLGKAIIQLLAKTDQQLMVSGK